ncbi:MAG: PEP-CTERM sorting domain-containing protein [Pseudohaliea sp.]
MLSMKKALASAGLVSSMVFAAGANAAIIPFWLAPGGDGSVLGVEYERLTVTGGVTVDVTGFTSPTTYTFEQSAIFDVTGAADPFGSLCFPLNLGGECQFEARLSNAVGEADLLDGSATFTGGTISLVDTWNSDFEIASFDIDDGGVGIDNTGVPLPTGNNESSIIALPTFFANDYFFFDSGATDDFGDEDFGFGPGLRPTTLNINLTLSDLQTTPGQAELEDGAQLEQITFVADGSARFEEVPAPATLALFALGLLGVAGTVRRKFNS